MTSSRTLRKAMLPATFAGTLGFVLIATLDTSVLPLVALIDALVIWWLSTLFLMTVKNEFSKREVK